MPGPKKTGSMLRSRDVAHILGCSSDDVIELACKGELKAEKQGRVWRFREEDLMAYLEKMAKRPESPTDLGKTPVKFGFLSRSRWNLIVLVIILLAIVALGWWAIQANPWLNPCSSRKSFITKEEKVIQ